MGVKPEGSIFNGPVAGGFIPVTQASQKLGIKMLRLRKMMDRGELTTIRVGHRLYVDPNSYSPLASLGRDMEGSSARPTAEECSIISMAAQAVSDVFAPNYTPGELVWCSKFKAASRNHGVIALFAVIRSTGMFSNRRMIDLFSMAPLVAENSKKFPRLLRSHYPDNSLVAERRIADYFATKARFMEYRHGHRIPMFSVGLTETGEIDFSRECPKDQDKN
jgi:hypothetical protein